MSGRVTAAVLVWSILVAAGGGVAALLETEADPAAPYVDALVEDTEQDESFGAVADAHPEAIECFSRAIVDAIGVDALEASGVTPRELGEADTLTGAGLAPDPAIVDVLVAAAGPCELASLMVDAFIAEFVKAARGDGTEVDLSDGARACISDAVISDPAFLRGFVAGYTGAASEDEAFGQFMGALGAVLAGCPTLVTELVIGIFEAESAGLDLAFSDSTRACLEGQFAARPDEVASAFGHADLNEFTGVLESALAGCPDTMVELLVPIIEGFGVVVSDTNRACLTQEISARPEEAAAAFAAGGGPESEAFGVELGRACELGLTGG